MKKLLYALFISIGFYVGVFHAMEVPQETPKDIEIVQEISVKLVNKTTGSSLLIPEDLLFPFFDMSRYRREIDVYLGDSFFPLLMSLLSFHKNMVSEGVFGIKELALIKGFFEKSHGEDMYDFASWFELVYLVDMFNLSPMIKDVLVCHITKLIKDHEEEAVNETQRIADPSHQLSIDATWKTIVSFYDVLFDQELTIGESEYKHRYSIQQLIILGKINDTVWQPVTSGEENKVVGVRLLLKGMNINSCVGSDLLLSFLPEEYRNLPVGCDFSNNKLVSLPPDFLAGFTLNSLLLSNNKLTSLPDNFLSSVPHLVEVSLKHNKLTSLPDNFLSDAPSLKTLLLSHNQLSGLPPTLLAGSKKLNELHVDHNQLQVLPDNFLSNSFLLKKLVLSNNQLPVLPPGFLASTTVASGLEELYIDHNQLQVLPDNFLSFAPHLKKLVLSYNQLSTLSFLDFLLRSRSLQVLDFSHNQLTALPNNFLPHVQELEELYFNHNKLTVLPASFLMAALRLMRVSFDHNQLQSLPDTFLRNVPLLKNVNFSHNNLSVLPSIFLPNAPQLIKLDISANRLIALPDNFLRRSFALKALYCQGNQLHSLPNNFLKNSPVLEFLFIKNSDDTLVDVSFSSVLQNAVENAEKRGGEAVEKRKAEEGLEEPEAKKQKK